MHAQADHLQKCTAGDKRTYKNRAPVYSRGAMSGWDILGLKSCISLKPLPPAELMDEWVPADGGGKGRHARMIGSHCSRAEVHPQLGDGQDDHQTPD